MIYGVKRVIKYLLGTDVAGRNLAVYSDDSFIVSYPRSGNTWTRFLVASLVYAGQPVTFANIERLIPDCEALSSRHLKRVARPRIIKSHEYFDPRYQKVIYIVRDPRDVALSYYDFSRKYRHIEDSYPLERYIGDFVSGRLVSADWGTWGENVGTWVAARHGWPTFLLLRYEDLIADTQSELAKVARFFGVDASPGKLRRAIESSSADHLRELEKKEGGEWVTTKNKRSDIPFIGSAVAGKWKSVLPDAGVEEIESAWGNIMAQLGYELVTRKAESAETRLAATAVPGKQRE